MSKEIEITRNNNARKVSHTSRSGCKRNYIKLDLGAGYKHNIYIFKECYDRILAGHEVLTRVKGENSNDSLVADLLDLDTGEIVEFQDSESNESIAKKRIYWENRGFSFNVIKV